MYRCGALVRKCHIFPNFEIRISLGSSTYPMRNNFLHGASLHNLLKFCDVPFNFVTVSLNKCLDLFIAVRRAVTRRHMICLVLLIHF